MAEPDRRGEGRSSLEDDLRAAEEAVSNDPSSAEAHNALGNVRLRLGDDRGAELAYRRAIECDELLFKPHGNLGAIAAKEGRHEDAVTLYRAALARNPASFRFQANLGNALRDLGRLDEAIAAYRASIAVQPNGAAVQNLALLLSAPPAVSERAGVEPARMQARGVLETALAALALAPDTPGIPELVRVSAALCGEVSSAAEALGPLAMAASTPELALALVVDLLSVHAFSQAYALGNAALERFPDDEELANRCGHAAFAAGRFDDADRIFRARPPTTERGIAALDFQAQAAKYVGDYAAAHAAYQRAMELAPSQPSVASAALLTMNYDPALSLASIARAHRLWGERFGGVSPLATKARDPSRDRPLRVGYVSKDLRHHAVSAFLLPLVESHDPEQVEVFCYGSGAKQDDVTGRFKALPLVFRDISRASDLDAARAIVEDRVDVLVDLGGHTPESRLGVFAYAPAPIQVTYLGYPNTTGLRAIGYRLTDHAADLDDADVRYTERLVRLPGCAWTYRPLVQAPAPARSNQEGIVFGSFNSLFKVTNDVLDTWAEVVRTVPRSRLLLKSRGLSWERARERIFARLEAAGVARERVHLEPPIASVEGHLAAYQGVDVALDSFPYNGTTTTCEALWMGVPVVSLAGDRHAGLVGKSLLGAADLSELVTASRAAYVQKAVELAEAPDRLAGWRKTLRDQVRGGRLGDANALARDVERAFRAMWSAWTAATS